MPTQTTLSRVESFPFDSRADGYDADGYPVYDRAVGAAMLRATFEKFFTDGVFPSPGTALQISKGSGLTVTINPGIFIIRGAMGGYMDSVHSLTLDTAAPQGNTCYGIMLRYDENEQYRSCYLRVVRGDAAGTPQPPAPDQSTQGVMEYRLGYVTVPTGSTDLANATVTNEKGLAVCPYAAPFEEIDVSEVLSDARNAANEALKQLLAYFEQYRDMVDAAVDDTLAGQLQSQITQIQEQLESFSVDFASEVDGFSIEYASDNFPTDPKKLRVKDGGIVKDSLSQWLQIELGIADMESWDYDDFKSMVQASAGDEDRQSDLVGHLSDTIVTSWTAAQITEFASLLIDSVQPTFIGHVTQAKLKSMSASEIYTLSNELSQGAKDSIAGKIDMLSYVWTDMHLIHQAIGDKNASAYVGKSKNVNVSGTNYPAILIGVAHDTATDSNGSTLTFQFKNALDVEGYKLLENVTTASAGYPNTVMRLNYFDKVINLFPAALKSAIREVTKPCQYFNDSNTSAKKTTFTGKVWPMSISELVDTSSRGDYVGTVRMNLFNAANGDGELYEYYAQHVWNRGNLFAFPSGDIYSYAVFRSGANNNSNDYCLAIMASSSTGSSSGIGSFVPASAAGICPCFCI